MVGTTGFEPATSCSQSKRSTKLSHVPTLEVLYHRMLYNGGYCEENNRVIQS